MNDSRYVVGIDLGTTNTVMSFLDTQSEDATVQLFRVPQTTAPGKVEGRDTLPSFLYVPGAEFSTDALTLPWSADGEAPALVGQLAREQGNKVPSRLVSSAKSWLCNGSVDRSAPILPWDAPDEVDKVSPLEASARYLSHLRLAWNHRFASESEENALERQQVLITVPASFDAIARELTLRAAKQAGLEQVTLLEEPQAAFYAWLHDSAETWRDQLTVGDLVLVCDIGGGTSDFSLIAVREQDGAVALERVAVGEHILLGGDNMDLALSVLAAQHFADQGHNLDAWQTRGLWHACRQAKEALLGDSDLKTTTVSVLGRGSKVIGGSITTELSRAEVMRTLLDGFLPQCESDERPQVARRGGLQELGLPYAADAGITRHLAAFLANHAKDGEALALPTTILFNGGVMKAPLLRQRITNAIDAWLAEVDQDTVRRLTSSDLDLAVSAGAAYYGMVRRGRGVRIRGGVARSYYIGIESAMPAVPGLEAPLKALCVVPFGTEEGTDCALPNREFGMVVGEPVEFRFLSSTMRKDDSVGSMVERWPAGEIEELAPIQTAIDAEGDEDAGEMVPVTLHGAVSELGTLDLELRARDGRSWRLEYNVREGHAPPS